MTSFSHSSVLLRESVEALVTRADGVYVDGTFGRGGHSRHVLDSLGADARLIGVDKDPEAVAAAGSQFAGDDRFEMVQGSFAALTEVLSDRQLLGSVTGVLLDLGVSSPQLDDPSRGFSFLHDGPLDMRMNPDVGESASAWLARAEAAEIADVLKRYGEERFAKRMAAAIVEAREESPLVTTAQLAKVIAEANPAWEKGKHPATRAFQGIRIHINAELRDLEVLLASVLDMLAVGGRLVVISFHSLEDRMVKRFIREQVQGKPLPKGLPILEKDIQRRMRAVGKAIKPSAQELEVNPRARSAVMRVAEKIA